MTRGTHTGPWGRVWERAYGMGIIWRTMYVGFTDSLPHFELLKFVHKIE